MHPRWKELLGSLVLAAILWATVIALAGCSGEPLSTREKGTLAGAAIGAGTGAIVGSAVGSPGAGAAIGGVVGGGTGMLIGNELQNQEDRERRW
jgi:phage tail tape-measure protein